MSPENNSRFDTRLVFGLAILILGSLLLLKNFDSDIGWAAWNLWPSVVVLLGLALLLQPQGSRQPLLGFALILIGLLLILNNFDVIRLKTRDIWPIILILLGISIVTRNFQGRAGRKTDADYCNIGMLLGGGKFKFDSKSFKGGKITAILGGGEIDLRGACLSQENAVIDVLAIMGGINIFVPADWQVVLEGTPILGGMEDKTAPGKETNGFPKLIIKGTSIMGGIDIRN